MKDFVFTADTVNRIGKQFELEMDLALNEDTVNSSLQMENTYIPELPDGTGLHGFFFYAKTILNEVSSNFRERQIFST